MPMPMFIKNDISEEEKENGIFWADYNTIETNFKVIAYSKVKYGYHYFYKTFTQNELNSNQAAIVVTLKEQA